jgi:hypothetical protein
MHRPFWQALTPHLQQLGCDLRLLRYIEELAEDSEKIANDPITVITDSTINEKFIHTDFTVIKHRHITPAIPPPDILNTTVDVGNICDDNNQFVCLDVVEGGGICGKLFNTFKHLQIHRMNSTTLGGDHGCLTVAALIITNECCSCLARFASRAAAKQHLRNAFTSGKCFPGKANTNHELCLLNVPIICKLCNTECQSIEEYNMHIIAEMQFPQVVHVSSPRLADSYDGKFDADVSHRSDGRPHCEQVRWLKGQQGRAVVAAVSARRQV